MKIDRSLNLVLTIERESGSPLHVHATPLSRTVFEAHFELLGGTYSEMLRRGPVYLLRMGPKVAALTLRSVGKKEAQSYGRDDDGGAEALLLEMRRLTNVLMPGTAGWDMLPLDVAKQRGLLSEDDLAEVESQVAFFSVISAATKGGERTNILDATAFSMPAQTVSQNCTEWGASLPTSKHHEHTARVTISSQPSSIG